MSRIRAITFDLDDTLWDIGPVIRRAEHALVEWLERHCPRVAARYGLEELRVLRDQIAAGHPHLGHDFTRLRQLSLRQAVVSCGYPRTAADAAFAVFLDARHEVRVHDDVIPGLRRLAAQYRLGCITNGNASVARLGLDRFFTGVVTAIEAGVPKPHPDIFHRACRMLSAAPQEVLHVGDDAAHDVEGARAAGLHAVWLRRDDAVWQRRGQPPVRVESLDGLLRLLDDTGTAGHAGGTGTPRTRESESWPSHAFSPSPAPRGGGRTTRS